MHYLQYNEPILHRTGALPLAHYYVDERHPRYHMRMHWHRETELLWMRQGALHLYIDNKLTEVHEGDLVVLGDGVLHGGEADDGVYECIVLDPYALLMYTEPCKAALKPVLGRTMFLKNQAIAAEPEFLGALQRLYAAVRGGGDGSVLRIVGALYEVFAGLAGHTDSVMPVDSSGAGEKAEQLKPALEYIENNYGSRISLETLARQSGLSPKYFCRCFRAITHRSPIDYLNHYRVECASFLLTTTDMSVAEIAQRCGYNDSSFFIKQFKRYKGATPHQYRAGSQD